MGNPLVSVIIPAYNVECYIRQCLDSVMSQSYPHTEIIVIDDGSTDKTSDIIQEYQGRYPEIKTYKQSNSRLSEARNQGMRMATGDYLFFIDSDDWIATEIIELLVTSARQYDCEMVQGDFYYAYADRLMWDCREHKRHNHHKILNTSEAMGQLVRQQKIKNFAWGKLWRRQKIEGLLFPKGKRFEDSFWTHQAIARCRTVGLLHTPLYYYRQRSDSISGKFSSSHFDLIEGNLLRYEFIKNNFPEYTQDMAYSLWKSIEAFTENAKPYAANSLMAEAINRCNQLEQSLAQEFETQLRERIEYRLKRKSKWLAWSYDLYLRAVERWRARKMKVYRI
ncbi:MAG: glycosyltransferase [Bacteroidales bacterium]|nr:glycosyltransferase [Bacteroidales bacterium]